MQEKRRKFDPEFREGAGQRENGREVDGLAALGGTG